MSFYYAHGDMLKKCFFDTLLWPLLTILSIYSIINEMLDDIGYIFIGFVLSLFCIYSDASNYIIDILINLTVNFFLILINLTVNVFLIYGDVFDYIIDMVINLVSKFYRIHFEVSNYFIEISNNQIGYLMSLDYKCFFMFVLEILVDIIFYLFTPYEYIFGLTHFCFDYILYSILAYLGLCNFEIGSLEDYLKFTVRKFINNIMSSNISLFYFIGPISGKFATFKGNFFFFFNSFDSTFTILILYVFFKSILLSLLLELIWPTHMFNKKNNFSYLVKKKKGFLEIFLKFNSCNSLANVFNTFFLKTNL